ncbi:hypothetical protein Aeqsu_3223 [Aequorivita sublithincola DSM 14238]|uniref:Secretion system C-terminal sorting domain-containing protein n=1 Tax=Aequorivita sublithincola (strain DSM 14238 / LMG 21431 / ACAM 643 / 9-3) TaxID=746697 RepID=I3Z084_AEQSU|nr:T9SS type A sorting domain-containing protein [Aequorivita sublithincola]AFL82652.1 hypothetical protein Aeqsu_3223 [Aequorivita sublithincola DSM 14238]
MKKITLLLVCLIGLSGMVAAQNVQSSSTVDDLLNRLSQIGTNAGDLSAYFTKQEQQTLHNYFNLNKNAPTSATVKYAKNVNGSGFGDFILTGNTQAIQLNYKVASDVESNRGVMAIIAYTDRPTFEGAYTGTLVNEDFSGGPGAGSILACGPVMSSGGDGCFAAGELEDGFSITASSGGDTIYIGAGAIGNTSTLVGANTFADTTVLNFSPDGAYAVGMDLFVDSVGNADIRVYDMGGTLMDTFTVSNTANTENFIGLISDDAIGKIEIQAEADAGELFGNLAFGTDPIGGGGSGPAVCFGANNTTSSIITFDPADPAAFTTLGTSPAPVFENAGAVDPNDDTTAYVLDSGGLFYSVDLTTGVYTNLGTILAPGGNQWSGAEFDPISGTLYAISVNGALTATTLSTIDIGALTATTIGLTGMAGGISLMIDANGDGYSHDIADDNFYYVDLASGTASPIGPLGFDANFGQGGTWIDGDPGFVYLSAFDSGAFQSQWRRVDVLTGSSTVIGLFNGGADQVGWSSAKGSLAVGIAENALEGFSYAPNPTSGVLSLKSINNIDTVAIYNMLGQNVMSSKIGATTSDLDISSLKTGTYIMQVTVAGQTAAFRVLKN